MLNDELKVNFDLFNTNLKSQLTSSFSTLETSNTLFFQSYKRIASLEAWKAYVLENKLTKTALDFFAECQNDALLSHSLAKIGSWRPSLQSLRSAIENTLFCLYYKDHPVEYELWLKGKHQIPISEYVNYIEKHPRFTPINANITGISLLKKEYSTLSKAVHSSSINFRMTDNSFPAIMLPDVKKLNQWLARENKTIQIINLMMLTMFYDDLQGAKLRDLRRSISISIPDNMHAEIKMKFNVKLFKRSQ